MEGLKILYSGFRRLESGCVTILKFEEISFFWGVGGKHHTLPKKGKLIYPKRVKWIILKLLTGEPWSYDHN